MKTLYTLMLVFGLITSISNAQEKILEAGAEEKLSPEEEAEGNDIGAICDALKKAHDAKKKMDHEKKIGRVSGAVNMSKLNQAGRDGVEFYLRSFSQRQRPPI